MTDRVYVDTQNPAVIRLLATQTDLILERSNLALEVTDKHPRLQAVAKKALARRTGARGLRTILESVLLDTMYELPSLEHVSKVVLDEAVINGSAEPYLIYRGTPQTRAVAE